MTNLESPFLTEGLQDKRDFILNNSGKEKQMISMIGVGVVSLVSSLTIAFANLNYLWLILVFSMSFFGVGVERAIKHKNAKTLGEAEKYTVDIHYLFHSRVFAIKENMAELPWEKRHLLRELWDNVIAVTQGQGSVLPEKKLEINDFLSKAEKTVKDIVKAEKDLQYELSKPVFSNAIDSVADNYEEIVLSEAKSSLESAEMYLNALKEVIIETKNV